MSKQRVENWTRVYTNTSKSKTKEMQKIEKKSFYTRVKKYKNNYELYIMDKIEQ